MLIAVFAAVDPDLDLYQSNPLTLHVRFLNRVKLDLTCRIIEF